MLDWDRLNICTAAETCQCLQATFIRPGSVVEIYQYDNFDLVEFHRSADQLEVLCCADETLETWDKKLS
jgi:hypothetical protein